MSPLVLAVHLVWLPSLFVLFLKMYRGPHPFLSALLAYFLGAVMILPALLMQLLWNWSVPSDPMASVLEMPVWLVPIEEGAKIFAALIAARVLGYQPPRRSFFPLALAAALGFGAAETAMAVMQMGPEVLPVRTLLSVPAHVIFTVLAAAGLAGKPSAAVSKTAFLAWWVLAALAHSAYNTLLLYRPNTTLFHAFLFLLGLGCLASALGYVRLRLRRFERD